MYKIWDIFACFGELVETLNLGCDSKKNFSSQKVLQTQTETCKNFLLTKYSHKKNSQSSHISRFLSNFCRYGVIIE